MAIKKELNNLKFNINPINLFKRSIDSFLDYKKYIFIYSFVLLIFAYLFYKFDFLRIFDLDAVRLWHILFLLFLSFLDLFIISLRFSIVSSQKYNLKMILYYTAGWAVSYGIPPKAVGEAFRIAVFKYFYKFNYVKSALFVALENLFDIIFTSVFALIAASILPFESFIDNILVTFFVVVLLVLFFYVFYYFFNKVHIKLKKVYLFNLLNKILLSTLDYIKKIKILSFKSIFLIFFLTFVRAAIASFRIYFIFLILGVDISLFVVFGVWIICLATGTLSMLPGGLGAYELTFVYLFSFLGLDKSISFLVVLFERVFSFWLILAIGFAIVIFSKKPLEEMRKEFKKYIYDKFSDSFLKHISKDKIKEKLKLKTPEEIEKKIKSFFRK